MYEPFATRRGKQYFSNKDELILPFDFTINLDFINNHDKLLLKIDCNLDSIKIELNDKVIKDMKNLINFCENYLLAHSIK